MDSVAPLAPRIAPPAEVIVTHKLARRQLHPHDYERESRVLREMTRELMRTPDGLIGRMAEFACVLTGAPSAGVSLIADSDTGERCFSWVAMAGCYARYAGGATPLNHSPCGYTLYKDSPQLFARPGRFYESLAAAEPELVEGLVVPIKGAHGFPLGTIWAASHGDGPEFDLEDARILASLADCFGAALELVRSRDEAVGRADEMARAVTDAAASSERKTNSIVTVAHELRNPLAPIISSVQALKLTQCTDQQAMLLSTIERQAARLNRLVDEMLDVARIERGEFKLNERTFELTSLINDALESAGEQFSSKAQRFETSAPTASVILSGDPEKLSEALANLLHNACKYTPEGGKIALDVSVRESMLIFVVTDTGIGISPEALRSIFQLYSRAPNTSGYAGLGVGLWLARRIVELHGGTIEAHSEGPGKGARFTMTLPGIVRSRD